MAFTFGFYNSINHDRMYDATQFMNLFDGILIDGVFMSVGDHFAVRPRGGLITVVGSGRAWFKGTWSYNSTDLIVRMPEPELVYKRIDAIVLEIDKRKTSRRNRICVIKGTPAMSNPARPNLAKGEEFAQYALAYITRIPEEEEITALNIMNVVGHEETPYATGLIQVHNVDAIWSQWEARFNEWFEKLRQILDGDVAGNLYSLIERLTIRVATLESEGQIHTGNGRPPASLGVNKNFYYDWGGGLGA
jgi:hypothetical protein